MNAEAGHPEATGSIAAADNLQSTGTDRHLALDAADAAGWWNRLVWEQAIERQRIGVPFSVDELQVRYDLPELGNGLGGVVLHLARAGVIKRVGYRPSNRASRSGGVVAVWERC